MISAAIRASGLKTSASRLLAMPPWIWWFLALAFIGVKSWLSSGGGIYGNLGDSDDLTRLIQVRELMASGNWFDTTTMKVGGDAGMLSHWSRLIDLPLAMLIWLFSLVMPVDDAERLTHAVWPLSLLAGLLWVTFRCVRSVGGDRAAGIVMVLTALSPFAWYQFSVGRIDHHNAMIAATVSAALLMWSRPQRIDHWLIAGALTGLALAIGYEALAPAVALGILATLWALLDKRTERAAGAFAFSLALVFALSFVATTAPSHWMDIHCDAISLNMVVLVSFGVAGLLVAVGPGSRWPLSGRLAVIAAFTAVGIAGFGVLEPKCLAGPEGQLPALLSTVWLDKVAEGESPLARIFRGSFTEPLALIVFFALSLVAQWRELWKTSTLADIFLFAILVIFVGLAFWQYKYVPYASCIALVPIAIAISRLEGIGQISAPTVRLVALVLANQSVLLLLAGGVDQVIGAPKAVAAAQDADAGACSKPHSIRDLADLPPGLFASHIDMGAYIAGLTHHRALSAPYHRIANAIIANYEIFSARDPQSAAIVLKQQHVDYIVICRGLDVPASTTPEWKGTLRADLVNGKAPGYLVPVPLPNPHSLYHVWKVDRAALNLLPSKAAASTQ